MKKILFTIAAGLCSYITAFSQTPTISNGSFETWTAPSGALSLEAPTDWSGSDKVLNDMSMLIMIGGYDFDANKQIYKIDNPMATDGSLLTELVTKNFGDDFGFIPGVLANGDIEVNGAALLAWMDSGEGDITSIFDISNASPMYGKRVDSVVVDATAWGPGALNGSVMVNAMKTIDGEETVIGSGFVEIENTTTMASELSSYTVKLNYMDEEVQDVDTLVILVLSSTYSSETPVEEGDENFVRIDNIRLFTSTPTSITSHPIADLGVHIYPNPAKDFITFRNDSNNNHLVINVYSINGQIMEQNRLKNGENTFMTNKYPQGVYTYEIIDTEKSVRQTGQFIK